jgi:hypothetical protein
VTDLHAKVARIIREVKDPDFAAHLVVDAVVADETQKRSQKMKRVAASRWQGDAECDAYAMHMHSIDVASTAHHAENQLPALVVSDLDQKKDSDYCAEPEPASPPVLEFPTAGKVKTWHLTQDFVEECRLAFPALDLEAEFRHARLWCVSNPGKRKTPVGMKRFLMTWLGNAQNKARASPARPQVQGDLAGLMQGMEQAAIEKYGR